MANLALLTGKKSSKDREKLTPFECGFDPFKKARMPFSLRFFIVTIIFLIFDVEIAVLIPIALIKQTTSTIPLATLTLVVLIILLAGLVHEWNQGALNWIY